MSNNKNATLFQPWTRLPKPEEWNEALDNLHMWTQIVGKIRLLHMPWINHSWHTTLYVTANGLTTSLIPHPNGGFQITFNFLNHRVDVDTTNGSSIQIPLEPMTVAEFYERITGALDELGISSDIYNKPVELPDPISAFPDNHSSSVYDKENTLRFWHALSDTHRVFTQFRSGFIGKASPVHFFWGAFDLAITLFSGNTAPKHPGGIPNCADWVMEEAYSHELASFGFWPGTGFGEPAFYAYAYPEPDGYREIDSLPDGAFYHEPLGEYLFPYRHVRNSKNPDDALLQFLKATCESAATHGKWDSNLFRE